ncbi:MAG: TonB-dependent receptor domain-containing protein [Marinifilaceae bacterium]
MKKLYLAILICLIHIVAPHKDAIASELLNNQLSGIITDSETKEALPGVTVYVPALGKGTVSDNHGHYQLEFLPKGKIEVQYSFIGYQTQVITFQIGDSHTEQNIQLHRTSVQTEEIVISGGFPSPQHQNAIKIGILTSEALAQSTTPSFGQSLAQVPGVNLISKGPAVTTPVIRGLSLNNILFLNNGVRMENFQFSENHPFLTDEFGVERVEIIKGPASLLHGSDAMGGVINLIREKPAPAESIKGDYHLTYHSNTKGWVNNLGVKGTKGSLFWMVRGGTKSHRDYEDGKGNPIPNSRFNSQTLKLGAGWIKDFGSFKLYYDYTHPKLGMTVPEAIPLAERNKRKNKVWYQDLRQHVLSSRNRLFLGKFRLEANWAYQFNNRRLNGIPTSSNFRLVDMDLKTFTYESKLYFPSSGSSEFLIGFQGMHQTNRNGSAPNHVIPDANIDDFSLFTLMKKKIGNLNLQTGIRYDHREIYVPEQEAGGHSHGEEIHEEEEEHEEELVHINKKFDNLNASAGLSWEFMEHLILRMNAATGYRTPNLAELTQHGMHGNRFEEGNADLKAQKSLEGDLGLHYHTHNHNIDLALFYNKVYDFIYLSPTDEPAPEGSGLVYRYQQENAKLYGGEFSYNVVPIPFLDISSSYTMVIGKQDNGDYLPFIPQHKLKFGLELKCKKALGLKKPYFKTSLHHAFEQNKPAPFETDTPDYTLVHINSGGDIQLGKQVLKLQLGVHNLFNKNYRDHLSTLKPLGFYNSGRNITASLGFLF